MDRFVSHTGGETKTCGISSDLEKKREERASRVKEILHVPLSSMLDTNRRGRRSFNIATSGDGRS